MASSNVGLGIAVALLAWTGCDAEEFPVEERVDAKTFEIVVLYANDVYGDFSVEYVWSIEAAPADSTTVLNPGDYEHRDASAVLQPDKPGTFVIERRMVFEESDSVSHRFTVNAANGPGIANAGPDVMATVGDRVQLDGSNSFDRDGDPLTFHWRLRSRPPESAAELSDISSPTPGLDLDVVGEFEVELSVFDGYSWSEPDEVIVYAAAASALR